MALPAREVFLFPCVQCPVSPPHTHIHVTHKQTGPNPLQCVRLLSVRSPSQTSSPQQSRPWSLGRLNHVAIALPDLQAATSFYRDVLGATVSDVMVRVWLELLIQCKRLTMDTSNK